MKKKSGHGCKKRKCPVCGSDLERDGKIERKDKGLAKNNVRCSNPECGFEGKEEWLHVETVKKNSSGVSYDEELSRCPDCGCDLSVVYPITPRVGSWATSVIECTSKLPCEFEAEEEWVQGEVKGAE